MMNNKLSVKTSRIISALLMMGVLFSPLVMGARASRVHHGVPAEALTGAGVPKDLPEANPACDNNTNTTAYPEV